MYEAMNRVKRVRASGFSMILPFDMLPSVVGTVLDPVPACFFMCSPPKHRD